MEAEMIDITSIVSLFFTAEKQWKEPKVAKIRMPDIVDEPIYKELKAKNHELTWSLESNLRKMQRDGWQPVTERDKLGRPTIFSDQYGDQILLHRAPKGT
jgi:hypothetical protein